MPTSTFLQRLLPDSSTAGDQFGLSVSQEGNYLAVAAQSSVYIFQRGTDGVWSRNARIFTPRININPNQIAISQDGLHLVTISPFNGVCYVYTRPTQTSNVWTQRAILTPPPGTNPYFHTVDLFRPPNQPFRIAIGRGDSVLVFKSSDANWSLEQELLNPGTNGSVSGFGDRLIIGAPNVNNFTGEASFWRRSGSVWNKVRTVTAPDPAAGSQFGFRVAMNANGALITAPFHSQNIGKGYIYKENGQDNWVLSTQLYSNEMALSQGRTGLSAGMGQKCAVMGAPRFQNNHGAYFFAAFTSAWGSVEGEVSPSIEGGSEFGSAVDATVDPSNTARSLAAVGAPKLDVQGPDAGAVFVFRITP